MTRVPLVRRGALAVIGVVLLAVGTSGCDAFGQSAATVNGHDIAASDVLALLKDRTKLPGDQAGLKGAGRDTYSTQAFADTLDRLIYLDILEREIARRHLTVTGAERSQALAALESSAGAQQLKAIPKRLRDFVIDFDAAQLVLQAQLGKGAKSQVELAQDQYNQILASTPDQLEQLCVTGAVFGSAADAATAKVRVDSGVELAAATQGLQVAQIVTQEQCASSQQLPAELKAAKVGSYVGPIQAQQGALLLRLARRRTATFDEVKADLIKNIPVPGQAQLQARVAKLVAQAQVRVDPRYGRWNRQAGRVDPPAGSTSATPSTTPATGTTGTSGAGSQQAPAASGGTPTPSTPGG